MTIGSVLGEYFALTETKRFYRNALNNGRYTRECIDSRVLARKQSEQFWIGKMLPNALSALGVISGGPLLPLVAVGESIRGLYWAFNELDKEQIRHMQKILIADSIEPALVDRDGERDLEKLVGQLKVEKALLGQGPCWN